MRLREKVCRTPLPLYDYISLELVLTNDMNATEDKRGLTERGQAHTVANENSVVVLLSNKAPLHHVAHEAVHVATFALKNAGVKASLSNDEPIAYLVDWVVQWITAQRKRR